MRGADVLFLQRRMVKEGGGRREKNGRCVKLNDSLREWVYTITSLTETQKNELYNPTTNKNKNIRVVKGLPNGKAHEPDDSAANIVKRCL